MLLSFKSTRHGLVIFKADIQNICLHEREHTYTNHTEQPGTVNIVQGYCLFTFQHSERIILYATQTKQLHGAQTCQRTALILSSVSEVENALLICAQDDHDTLVPTFP